MNKANKSLINQLICSRRTIHQFIPDKVPDKSLILNAIDTARWAPNHYLSQPWHFYLLGDETTKAIVKLNSRLIKDKLGDKAANIKFERWSKIPGWIILTCDKSENQIKFLEDYAACCCAAQNMMLSLWQEDIGVKWTTGEVIREPEFYRLTDINPELELIVGMFWYGYAEEIPKISREPIEKFLTELP